MTILSRTAPAVVVAALAFGAAPAGAAPSSVDAQLKRADQALTKAASLAKEGSDRVAAAQVRRADKLTDAAARSARRGSRADRAEGAADVAAQYQQNAEAAARLIDDTEGSADAALADVVTQSVDGRQKALDTLSGLMAKLPAKAQTALAKAMTAITDRGLRPASLLERAVRAGEVDASAMDETAEAFTEVTDGARQDVGRLEALAKTLPAAAQKGIAKALERVSGGLQRAGVAVPGGALSVPSVQIPVQIPVEIPVEIPVVSPTQSITDVTSALPGIPSLPGLPG